MGQACSVDGNSSCGTAAVYYDDMYVEREYSLQTSRTIQGAKVWVTNEYEHNGLRANGERVVGRLLELLEP